MSVFGIYSSVFSGYTGNHCAARAAFKFRSQCLQNVHRCDGVNLDAAIAQIFRVPRDAQPLGYLPDEITKADALHDSADVKALCLLTLLHGRCGRRAAKARF